MTPLFLSCEKPSTALCVSEGRRPRRPQASSPAKGTAPREKPKTQPKTFPGRGRSPLYNSSRKVREVRKEMEGGNGESAANEITLCSKGEMPYCEAENAPWMAPVLGGLCLYKK